MCDPLLHTLLSNSLFKAINRARCRFRYLAVYFVAVILGAHLDELAIDSLEDVEDVPHQRRLAHLPCAGRGREDGRFSVLQLLHSIPATK